LVDKFNEVLDIDIIKLSDTLSPLGTGKGGIMLPFETKRPAGSIDSEEEAEADLVSDSDSNSSSSSDSESEDETSEKIS